MLDGLLGRAEIEAIVLDDEIEAPDLAMIIAGKRVGVEVTEIQKSANERALRAPKDDVVRRARRQYEGCGGIPLSVTFSFHYQTDMRSVDRKTLGSQIADFLALRAPKRPGQLCVIADDALSPELRCWLRELRFWSVETSSIWQIAEAGWVAALTPNVLQDAVNGKASLLSTYRLKGFDEYWLLICAQPLNPACRFEPGDDFDAAAVCSPFDRTFFYDAWHLFELGVKSDRAELKKV
jgi:hypothetical protein